MLQSVVILIALANCLWAGDSISFLNSRSASSAVIPVRISSSLPLSSGMYWNSMLSHIVDLSGAPAAWSMKDWKTAAGILSLAGFAYHYDDEIAYTVQTVKTQTSNRIGMYAEPFGNKKILVPMLSAMYIGGIFRQSPHLQKTALTAMESFLITNMITAILKRTTGRIRPYCKLGHEMWTGASAEGYRQSFPSGHTAYAFSVATVFATEFSDVPLVPWISYGVAGLVGLSRMNSNVHWSSDVLCGAALGYFIGKAVTRFNRDKQFDFLSIIPRLNTCGVGVDFSYSIR